VVANSSSSRPEVLGRRAGSAARRICLNCGCGFKSRNVANRICKPCGGRTRGLSEETNLGAVAPRGRGVDMDVRSDDRSDKVYFDTDATPKAQATSTLATTGFGGHVDDRRRRHHPERRLDDV
jgi:hypothetical protein